MKEQDELRLSQFRADLLRALGEIYSELSALRKSVRPARLFGEAPVEELMELIAHVYAEFGLCEAILAETQNELTVTAGGREDGE